MIIIWIILILIILRMLAVIILILIILMTIIQDDVTGVDPSVFRRYFREEEEEVSDLIMVFCHENFNFQSNASKAEEKEPEAPDTEATTAGGYNR